MTAARYFVRSMFEPGDLLRRVDLVDQRWTGAGWEPTKAIIDWEFGHDDFVDAVTEVRRRHPDTGASG